MPRIMFTIMLFMILLMEQHILIIWVSLWIPVQPIYIIIQFKIADLVFTIRPVIRR